MRIEQSFILSSKHVEPLRWAGYEPGSRVGPTPMLALIYIRRMKRIF